MRIAKPTIEQLENVIKNSDGFYKKEYNEFTVYTYRLADWNEFKEHNAFELRGLTVDNETGIMYPSIHKFFNYKENPLTDYEFESDYEVMIKEDGSLIQPIVKPNESEVIYKTKANFEAEQIELVKEYNEKNNNIVNKFVLDMFNEYGYIPLFEITSPKNQIVVEYKETKPILIQMRSIDAFEYIPYEIMKKLAEKYGIPVVNVVNMTFQEILEKANEVEGIEGWVVRKANPKNYNDFMKIKTLWYFNLHKLLSPNNLREDYIIEHVLNETIDDVLAAAEGEKKEFIEKVAYGFINWYNTKLQEIKEIVEAEKEHFKQNPKEVVEKVRTKIYFPVVMKLIREKEYNEELANKLFRNHLKKQLNSYSKVKEFLKEEGIA